MSAIVFLAMYCGYGDWGPCGQTEPGFLDALAITGGTDDGLWITGILLLLGAAALFTYNHLKKKKHW